MTDHDHATAVPTSAKGGYALLLRLSGKLRLKIGRLGSFDFPAGTYLYFGSALGGLDVRVRRHLNRAKKRHWHIDHLTAVAPVVQVWWATCTERLECTWAGAVSDLPGVTAPAPGFGSSDCSCPSHLVLLPETPDAVESARGQVGASRSGVALQVTQVGVAMARGAKLGP